MMRRKINNELKEYLLRIGKDFTPEELVLIVNTKFNEKYDEDSLRKYLWRNKIPYKYECKNRSNNSAYKRVQIGTEYTKPDGMIMVKVSKNEWVYKQRLIYEQYHNVKLKEDEYVIFLDGNRGNFNIDNLKVLTRQEASYLGNFKYNYGIDKTNKDIIETEIELARLMIKTKEK